jgi:outer membrane lipoprotein SlyB
MSNFGNMNTNYGHGILGAVAGAILGSKVEDEVRRRSQHK